MPQNTARWRPATLVRLLALSFLALLPLPARAQAPAFTAAQRADIVQVVREALKADPTILREALAALQADDARVQENAAQAAIASQRAALIADPRDPVAGDPKGDVTMVYFYDTRCPYCRRMAPALTEILRQEPRLRLVYKDLPILGPASVIEAQALLAAQRQDGYFKLHDVFNRSGGMPTKDSIRADATRIGLDGAKLVRDMDDPAIQAKLDADLALARTLQIQGTPAMVIGDRLLPGAVEVAELRQAIAAARAH